MNPTFSIIIPVYNAEKNISCIVNQITNITFTDYELILVNDGSTDVSKKILDSINNKNIKVIHQKNSGPSLARNTGIKKSSGEYILFFDADDIINTKELNKTLSSFNLNKAADLTVFGWKIKYSNGTIRTIKQNHQLISKNNIVPFTIKSIGNSGQMYNLWNKIYKSKIIKNNNLLLNENLKFGEDLTFNFNFIQKSNSIEIIDSNPYYTYIEESPSSIVSYTKLNYDFRQQNLIALNHFSRKQSLEVKEYANFVKWRWLISYALAICKTNYSFNQKKKLIKIAIKDQKLKPEKKVSSIGYKKFIMEYIFYILSLSPAIFTFFINIISNIKKHQKNQNITIVLPKIS